MSLRISKINELIRRNIDDILLKDLSLKEGVFITVAKVDTTPDLRYTRVSISVYPEQEVNYAQISLKNELFKIQGLLNKKLHMRPLPKLEFRIDFTEARADVIEKLLKEI
jgi:ribosome-binding factor A